MAKHRVAPIKTLTLSQLELMAALIGARLASFVKNAINSGYEALEVHLSSNSQIVLHWLNSRKKLKYSRRTSGTTSTTTTILLIS